MQINSKNNERDTMLIIFYTAYLNTRIENHCKNLTILKRIRILIMIIKKIMNSRNLLIITLLVY